MNAFVYSAKNEYIFEIFSVLSVGDKAKFIYAHVHVQFLLSKTDHFIDYTDNNKIIEYIKFTGER